MMACSQETPSNHLEIHSLSLGHIYAHEMLEVRENPLDNGDNGIGHYPCHSFTFSPRLCFWHKGMLRLPAHYEGQNIPTYRGKEFKICLALMCDPMQSVD